MLLPVLLDDNDDSQEQQHQDQVYQEYLRKKGTERTKNIKF